MMEHTEWDSVLQFVSDSPELEVLDKQSAEDIFCCPSPSYVQDQIPTPPQSHDGTPVVQGEETVDSEGNTLVSVSTTFFPGAGTHTLPPDIVFLTSDAVFFYVHSHVLLSASDNGFHSLLPAQPTASNTPILNVSDASTEFNVLLHAVYDISCAHYSPTYQTLATAVERLPYYGIHPISRISPSTPLYTLLLTHAPLYPLELYALAATFELDALAIAVSSHLLGFRPSSITDEMARQIGPVYLKRLFFLHFGRIEALKRILLPPPRPHPPTPLCDFVEQKKLTRAWALASAYLAWDARPDVSTSTMESTLKPLQDHLPCDQCRAMLRQRIKDVIIQWSVIKRTI